MTASNISIIVPTISRMKFVLIMARALSAMGFSGTFALCDSSDRDVFDQTARLLDEQDKNFRVIHHHLPGKGNAQAVGGVLSEINTPYAMYMPDDDIPVLRTLELCAAFLDRSPDYNAVSGRAVIMPVDGTHVLGAGPYVLRAFEQPDPVERIKALFADYCVAHYALVRTEDLIACWRAGAEIKERYFSGELLINCLQLLKGKTGLLDDLFVVRQDHAQRVSTTDFFDWITSRGWGDGARAFLEIVVRELASVSDMSEEAAALAIKGAFWSYLNDSCRQSYQAKFQSPVPSPIRRLIRQSPLLHGVALSIKSYLPGVANQLSLESLLRPGTRYNADFMPIYRAITTAAPYKAS